MEPHDRDNYRQQMGHVWLGFSSDHMRRLLSESGFDAIRIVSLSPDPKVKGPGLFVATAQRQMQPRRHEDTKKTPTRGQDGNSYRKDAPVRRGEGRGPRTVQSEGSLAGRVRPQGNPTRRAGDAGPHGAAQAARREEAACRLARDGQPPHDDSNRGADRDAGRARRRRALGVVQHLLDPGSRRRRGRRGPRRDGRHAGKPARHAGLRVEGRDARRILVVHERSARVARRNRPDADRGRWGRCDARGAQGRGVREGRQGSGVQAGERSRRVGRDPQLHQRVDRARQVALDAPRVVNPRRQRGDDDRGASPLSDDGSRHAALPRHQRQRLGHQEQVRQHLWLPPLAARWPRPRDGRDAGRQGRGRGSASAKSARDARSRCAARARASSSPRSIRSAPCRRRWKATRSRRSTT